MHIPALLEPAQPAVAELRHLPPWVDDGPVGSRFFADGFLVNWDAAFGSLDPFVDGLVEFGPLFCAAAFVGKLVGFEVVEVGGPCGEDSGDGGWVYGLLVGLLEPLLEL